MLTTLAAIAAMLLVPAYAFSDRFTGGGFGWDKLNHDAGGPLRGRGTYYVTLPLMGLGYLAGGLPLAVAALVWAIYRAAFPWKLFGGVSAMTPGSSPRELLFAYLRHAIGAPILFGIDFVCKTNGYDFDAMPYVFGNLAFAAVATILAKSYSDQLENWKDLPADVMADKAASFNNKLEIMRGGAFGLAMSLALLYTVS